MTVKQTMQSVIGFELTIGDKIYPIDLDAKHPHPPEVYQALGIDYNGDDRDQLSESELAKLREDALQSYLLQYDQEDLFDANDQYLGPDREGLGLRFG